MSNLSSEVKSKVSNATKGVENTSFPQMAQYVGEHAGAMASDTLDQIREYYDTSRRYVESHPTRSVALAAVVGACFGGLLTMAMRRRD